MPPLLEVMHFTKLDQCRRVCNYSMASCNYFVRSVRLSASDNVLLLLLHSAHFSYKTDDKLVFLYILNTFKVPTRKKKNSP